MTNAFLREPAGVYESVNRAVLRRVPRDATTLLDVGCGSGSFAAAVRAAQPCTTVGVTWSEREAELARRHLDRVEVADLNHFDPRALGMFDCIVCSHVLEHLMEPRRLLRELVARLSPGGTLVVALPNALHWKQRWQFVRGRFRYTEGGLMDSTHLRFFDHGSAAELLREAGLDVVEHGADGSFPASRRLGRTLGGAIDTWALRRFPGLFAFQFVSVCRAREPRADEAVARRPSVAIGRPGVSEGAGVAPGAA